MVRYSLASKIALLTSVLLVALGAVMLVTFSILSARQIDRTIQADATNAAKQISLYLSAQSKDLGRQCQTAATGDARTRGLILLGDKATAQGDVNRIASQYSVTAVAIVDGDGKPFAESSEFTKMDSGKRQRVQDRLSEAVKAGADRTTIVHGGGAICFMSCAFVRSGAFLRGGVCFMNRLGSLQASQLVRSTSDEVGFIADGKVVASSLPSPFSPPKQAGTPESIVLNGENYVAVAESLPGADPAQGLQFAILRPTRAIVAPYAQARNAFVTVLGFALAVSIGIGIAFGRSLAKPISSLADAARVVQSGDWPEPIAVQRQDEIGTLQTSFNDMVSASKHAQDELHQAEKIKKEFLSNMSHELRTPMNGILGVSELLRQRLTDARAIKLLDLVVLSSERLHGVLGDILTLAAFEAGRSELAAEPLNLDDLIVGVVDLYRAEAYKKGLAVEVVSSPDDERLVWGDSIKLKQLFGHLISNAIKFTQEGSVRLAWSYKPVDGGVELDWSVTDTGVGIPEGVQDSLFAPFTQLDGSTTRKYEGVGLGLTITRQIIGLMGGKISLDSKVGKGTTVRVQIPFRDHAS